ncbi:MAG: hypothetical protein M1830_000886 [Pleopsidium flavum]|nr:MAG: hypothetical protein M1830_000897 [Pleopsidium flavum]KAI9873059.1 MAG: hypothetical protein M1830_000886 [Pleopsidium flavum]
MPPPSVDSACPFLRLPLELRDQIYGEVFFPGEDQPEEFGQDRLGLANTAVRQLHPYNTDERRKPKQDLAIMRTCRNIHEESEAVFYGTSSFNLMYQDWEDSVKWSYEFLENLPTRNRRLIRRIERKCYSAPYYRTISLCDWKLFMTFLARECPSLQSLKLWGPGDPREGPRWVETCQREKGWVQAILQINSLVHFDIPVIKGGVIYDYQTFREDFLPWLRMSLLQKKAVRCESETISRSTGGSSFPFLKLPSAVRKRVYRHLLLPPEKLLHPYLKPWYDQTTRNVVPLLQTCRSIHEEAEKVLYQEAVFTSLIPKYNIRLLGFFQSLSARLRCLVRRVRLEDGDDPPYPLIKYLVDVMQVDELVVVVSTIKLTHLNEDWQDGAGDRPCTGWYKKYLRQFARLKTFRVETLEQSSVLDPACRVWLETGLRLQMENPSWPESGWLFEEDDDPSAEGSQPVSDEED